MAKEVLTKEQIELLKVEYKECNTGYNYRDNMIHQEFVSIIRIFSFFITLIIAFNTFIETVPFLHFSFIIIIGIAGFLSLFSMILDIQSNSSCNIVLRKRATEIEEMLSEESIFVQWSSILNRKKYFEERLIKGMSGSAKDSKEPERNIFITASRFFIIIWLAVVIVAIGWGNLLMSSVK